MKRGERALEAARAALGARFRLHGRDAVEGLDCVGLAGLAFDVETLPSGYALRSGEPEAVAAGLRAAGLARAADRQPGDLLLMQAGPGQLHLAIWSGDGMVHADARLRRVVERPGLPPWPVLACWRFPGGEE